ncbi:MAG TPA: TIGR03790 family protein [Candidatus Paceibacterota bacterium]|nr:TIGR03790 family protein [Verrucomicrobiota bacterium]HSA10461.1 TIGR03790 family protein [Candidatus Paceibacterota bacterium]
MQFSGLRGPALTFLLALSCTTASHLLAGGSGLNTVVVVNQNSANSRELGNYYCERRQVPPENVLRIAWSGGNTNWSSSEFQAVLLTPLLEMLAARQLASQIEYVVLSMDIPFQTVYGGRINSTTSALFYGLKDDSPGNARDLTNSYYASEQAFPQAKPASAPGFSFLATMLTAGSLAQAKQLVDQGVTSDSTWPTRPAILAKSSDTTRNIRYRAFDNAIFNSQLLQRCTLLRTNTDSILGLTNLLGCETGLNTLGVPANAFIPGAMADNLTSYGGVIIGTNLQTSLLAFIHAGAAGSYGTVTEPTPNTQKFPSPQNYFYQGRGFCLAECYYQSLYLPYQGLIVGEPLAAPFARKATASWVGTPASGVIQGAPQLGLAFASADPDHRLQQVDLFVDGKYYQTLTNCPPCPGNHIKVALNGYPLTYTVSTNATLATIACGLAALINAPTVTNLTCITAQACGDRVELRSLATNPLATPYFITDYTASSPAGRYYRAQYVSATPAPLLRFLGRGTNGSARFTVETPEGRPSYLQASTDLSSWVTIFTNHAGGAVEISDTAAGAYPRRFYRLAATPANRFAQLAPLGMSAGQGFRMRAVGPSAAPYVLQTSSNLLDWSTIFTNSAGGTADFLDPGATNSGRRFYRTLLWAQALSGPAVTVHGSAGANGVLLRVDGAVEPYVLLASTNQSQWTPIYTNSVMGQPRLAVSTASGSANALTTFATASRSTFLNSPGNGMRTFNVTGTIALGAWLQLHVTKTNCTLVSLAVTNQSSTATLYDLARQLVTAINACVALQGEDGVLAEDLMAGGFGTASFSLYARSPGREAAGVQAKLVTSATLGASPSSAMRLDVNLSDLLPRNHIYVIAGASAFSFDITIATTSLADGFHELAAVGYEGTHVRTQTRTTLPLQVQNTSLSASLTLPELVPMALAQGQYHVQVAANTTNVTAITLFSTGGALGTVTNQSAATFTVDGAFLGAGLHPFYATVHTADGRNYRTATTWTRLVSRP